MNLHPLRTLLLIPLFALLMLAARPASAQPPLPLPTAADSGIRGAVSPLSPVNGEPMLLFNTNFAGHLITSYVMWSHVNDDVAYTIQFKVPGAGKIISVPVIPECYSECLLATEAFAHKLFKHTHTGEQIKWRVIATDGIAKMTSPWAAATAYESFMTGPSVPADGDVVSPKVFTWQQISPDKRYTLVIQDKTAGKTVVKQNFAADAICGPGLAYTECSVTAASLGVVFAEGHKYSWHVKSVGPTKEKHTSAKYTFTAPLSIIIGL